MHDILSLRGVFEQRKNTNAFGQIALSKGKKVSVNHLNDILRDLRDVLDFWQNNTIVDGALVDINYDDVIAKSNRIRQLFSKDNDSNFIVGARFAEEEEKHIITYFVSLEQLSGAIQRIELVREIIKFKFDGVIDCNNFELIESLGIDFASYGISKTAFQQLVVGLSRVESMQVPNNNIDLSSNEAQVVTFYNVGIKMDTLFRMLGLSSPSKKLDELTAYLVPVDVLKVKNAIPYMVAMSLVDLEDFKIEHPTNGLAKDSISVIPQPTNEPVIGVIDLGFNTNAYFADWVEYHNMTNDKHISADSAFHGTAVSSIIVDGPRLNPDLDDGCGYFRARHFAVIGEQKSISVSDIIKKVKTIVEDNLDIKVWNLSIGGYYEVAKSSISPLAALLDELQYEYDIIFIVAGTNLPKDNALGISRIGPPADSINSIVVNAVDRDGAPASYTRRGEVLTFFIKPDVAYYGGDKRKNKNDSIAVFGGERAVAVDGTSFAAPWIARKMAYLICKMGLSREVAKALLIDSATGWNEPALDCNDLAKLTGFGVVPLRIEDIIGSTKDEIKFVISEVSTAYDTYNYNIPVPMANNEFPYLARATMCYFPKCNRLQGVDYTNTELDVYFGRVNNDGGIKSINENKQSRMSGEPVAYTKESVARKLYRKWDNVKHIQEYKKQRSRARKMYATPLWGLSIKTKERLDVKYGEGIRFGLVITLKEINGKDRLEDFIRQCQLRGWLVNRININNRLDLYNKMQEEIEIK